MSRGRVAVGHPVDVASGEFFTFAADLVLDGTVPLVVGRCYRAPLESQTALFRPAYDPPALQPFGPGWSLCCAPGLEKTASGFALTTMDGDRLAVRETRDAEFAETGRLIDPAVGIDIRRTSPTEVRVVRFGVTRDPLDMVFQDCGPHGFRAASFARTRQARLDFAYDDQGRLAGLHQVREARTARLVWDGPRVRQLALEVRPAAPEGAIVQPAAPPIQRILLSFDYDHWGRIVAVHDDDGVVSRYGYDVTGRMDREASRSGSFYSMAYDRRGRCIRVSGRDRYQERTLTYRERETLVADSHGRTTRYLYNEAGQVLQEKSPSGYLAVSTFDDLGRRVETIDQRGGTTRWTYDAEGRTASVSTPDGVVETYTHDTEHRLVAREEAPGRRVELGYDEDGGVARVQARGRAPWLLTRNEFGEWIRLTNPEGSSRVASRDPYGHVRAASDFRGATFRYERDEMGRVSARIDPLGHVTRYAYNRGGELVWQHAADGTTWTRSIDASGRRTEYLRPDGRRAVVSLSSCGQPTSVQGFDGSVVEYEWDTEPGELRVVRNAAAERYELAYDVEGNVASRVHFDGRKYALRWAKGNLLESIDPCGRSTMYAYDAAGRIVSRTTPEGETAWRYCGRDVAEIANENGALAYERDERGDIVLERQGETEIRYERDAMGRRTRATSKYGDTKYGYDANGDWASMEHGDARITIERDALGREVTRTIGKASSGALGSFDQAFDPLGRLTGQRYRPGGGAPSWGRSVAYDAVGNPRRVEDSARGTTDYLHNAAGQLVGVLHEGGAGEFYEWDSRGNIFYEVETPEAGNIFAAVSAEMSRVFAITSRVAGVRTERRFGHGSRITESKSEGKTITYLHDSAGCVVEKRVRHADGRVDTHRFGWNTLGQLVHAVLPDESVWTYRYDGRGRRVAKISPEGEETRFVWDGYRVTAEISGFSANAIETGERSTPPARSWVFGPGQYKPAMLLQGSHGDQRVAFCFADQSAATSLKVDTSGQKLALRKTWGENSSIDDGGFCNQRVDAETGLYFNVFRYYDPDGRRFLTPDPIGIMGGLNVYAFVAAPTREWDPLGLTAQSGCDAAASLTDEQKAKIAAVLEETEQGSGNFGSKYTLTPEEALAAGEMWVGPGYQEMGGPGTGVFRSADGERQFRIDEGSITGGHGDIGDHVHYETVDPARRGRDAIQSNNHVPLV